MTTSNIDKNDSAITELVAQIEQFSGLTEDVDHNLTDSLGNPIIAPIGFYGVETIHTIASLNETAGKALTEISEMEDRLSVHQSNAEILLSDIDFHKTISRKEAQRILIFLTSLLDD